MVTIPPCAATMEVRCLAHPSHRLFQYCLRLLKLVVQCDYIVRDAPAPNSHFLKVALLNYIREVGPPTRWSDVACYVVAICRRFTNTGWRSSIPYFVSDVEMPSPPVSVREELLSAIMDWTCFGYSCFQQVTIAMQQDCNLL